MKFGVDLGSCQCRFPRRWSAICPRRRILGNPGQQQYSGGSGHLGSGELANSDRRNYKAGRGLWLYPGDQEHCPPGAPESARLQVFANEFDTARARTAQLGAKYPEVLQIIWTAEQAALTGSQTPQAALAQAQQEITTILNS